MKTTLSIIELKKQLLEAARAAVREKIVLQRKAMEDAQKEANSHKGAMASRYDTFKEEAQALRNGHARQVQELAEVAALLDQIKPEVCDQIRAGAVVVTSQARYFVSTGLLDDPIVLAGQEYHCISPGAPILRLVRGKPPGATIQTPAGPARLEEIY